MKQPESEQVLYSLPGECVRSKHGYRCISWLDIMRLFAPRYPVMTRNILGDSRAVGPVTQFSLLLIPIVMNCFFMVYSLTGWIIDGRDKLNWSLEALTVGLWVAAGLIIFCVLVIVLTYWRGGHRWHPLVVSSVGHIVLALLLTLSIFITVKL